MGAKTSTTNITLTSMRMVATYRMQIDKATFDAESFRTGQPVELEIWQDRVTMLRQTVPAKSVTLATAFPNQTVAPALARDPDFTTPGVRTVEALDSPARTAQTQANATVVFGIIAVASAGAIIFALISLRRSRKSRTVAG